MKLRAKELRRK